MDTATNATPWHIKPATTIGPRCGREVSAGWDLFHGDDWSQRYATKREAMAGWHRVQGHILIAGKWRSKATGYKV